MEDCRAARRDGAPAQRRQPPRRGGDRRRQPASPTSAPNSWRAGAIREHCSSANGTYVDIDSSVRIVDWRHAPVSKSLPPLRRATYEEEMAGASSGRGGDAPRGGDPRLEAAPSHRSRRRHPREGRVDARRQGAREARGGQLSRCARPRGGAPRRRQPPRPARRRRRGPRGPPPAGDPALIGPRQFEPSPSPSGIVLIRAAPAVARPPSACTAWRGSPSNQPKRFARPTRCSSWCSNRALASLHRAGAAGARGRGACRWPPTPVDLPRPPAPSSSRARHRTPTTRPRR